MFTGTRVPKEALIAVKRQRSHLLRLTQMLTDNNASADVLIIEMKHKELIQAHPHTRLSTVIYNLTQSIKKKM